MIKNVNKCEYKFKAKYVCLNGKACIEKVKAPFLGSKQATTYKVDCKCPLKNSFKFGPNYCTTDLEACDYLKLDANLKKYKNKCGNDGITTFKPFISWSG